MFKNNEYSAIKVIGLIAIIGVVGWIIAKSMGDTFAPNQARVLPETQSAPWRTYRELDADGKLGGRTISDLLEVTVSYDTAKPGVLSFDNLAIKKGFSPRTKFDEDGLRIQTLDASGRVLSSRSFRAKKTEIHAFPAQNGSVSGEGDRVSTAGSVVMLLPFSETAATVHVVNKENVVLASQKLSGITHVNNTPTWKGLDGKEFQKRTRIKESRTTSFLTKKVLAAGDPMKYEFVFIGNGYSSAELAQFHTDVNNFANSILSIDPMRSRASQLSFAYVDNTTDLSCIHTQVGGEPAPGRLITCNNTLATQLVNTAGAPYDKIVIITKDAVYGGSGGSIPVAYNGSGGPAMIIHEALGHSVGGNLDVYPLYTSNGTIDNHVHSLGGATTAGNCYAGTPPASVWSGMVGTADYTATCNYPNWYDAGTSMMENLGVLYFTAPEQQMINTQLDLYAGSFSDSSNPTVTIASPLNGAVVSSGASVTVTTSASDNLGVARVAFYVDATLTKNIYLAPYMYTFSGLSNGTHTIEVRAYDAENNFGTSTASITVGSAIGGPDTQAPTAPTNLSASNTTQTATTISWTASTDNVGVTGYDIYKNGSLAGTTTGTSYTATGLTASTTYAFTVKAKDLAGNVSPASSSLSVTTTAVASSTTAITYPTNGQVLTAGVQITITATIPSNANKATLYRQYNSNSMYQVGNDSTSPYSFNWTPNSSGTYTLRVKAYQGNTLIGTSSDVIVTVGTGSAPDTQAPTTPTNLSSTNTTQIGTSLSWTASTDNVGVTGYDIYRNGTLAGSTTTTSYNASGLTSSTTYSFTVKAKDAVGNVSGTSSAVSVTTLASADTTPPIIGAISTSGVLSNGATVSWTTDEASDSQVEYGTTTVYGFLTALNTSMVTNHSQMISGLSAETTYYYRVKSKDVSGNLAVSGSGTFTTLALADTTAPVIGAISSGTPTTAGTSISWTTNEASDSQVEYGTTTSYGASTVLDTPLVTSHAVTLTNLSASTTYHFRVRSKDGAGNLAISADGTFVTATPSSGGDCTQTVCITYPINGQTVSGAIIVSADVTIGGVGSVTFYGSWNGNSQFQLTSADNTAPYTNTWTPQSGGTYTITAKAWSGTYASGTLLGTSAPVVVTK